MDDATPPQTGQPERNTAGRFVAGNKCGKGNPLGRRMSYLRGVFLNSVTELEVQAVKKAIYDAAVAGDTAAQRLWVECTNGKTRTAEDEPDDDAANEPMVIAAPLPKAQRG